MSVVNAETNTHLYDERRPSKCTASGLWQLLHNTTQMLALLQNVKHSVNNWPGSTIMDDVDGVLDNATSYKEMQLQALCELDKHLLACNQSDAWVLQWLTLATVWQLPAARAHIKCDTPQKVNDTFFAQFDERMNKLVFGTSSSANTHCVAHMPLEIVLIMLRFLKDSYTI